MVCANCMDNAVKAPWTGDIFHVEPKLLAGTWTLYGALLINKDGNVSCLVRDTVTVSIRRPQTQELQLEWSDKEAQLYNDPAFGAEPMHYQLNGKAPAAELRWNRVPTSDAKQDSAFPDWNQVESQV